MKKRKKEYREEDGKEQNEEGEDGDEGDGRGIECRRGVDRMRKRIWEEE